MLDPIVSTQNKKEKEVVALKALQFIKDGTTILMDGGSTNLILAAKIPTDISLRVITNNICLISILSHKPNIDLIILGGRYHQGTRTTLDNFSFQRIENYVADTYFFGACALDEAYGITTNLMEEVDIKRMMRMFSKRTVVLANEQKLDTHKPFKVCNIDEVDVIITNLKVKDPSLNAYRDWGALLY